MLSFDLIYNLEAVAACPKIFIGMALVHFQKYWLLSGSKKAPTHTYVIIKWSLRESETILMNEAAATIYTRLTATAESLLIMYTKS